jgi:uncharacterized membrane protein
MSVPAELFVFSLAPALLWGISPTFTKRGLVGGGTSLQASVVVVTVGAVCYWLGLVALGDPSHLRMLSVRSVAIFSVSGVVGAVAWLASFTGVKRVGASVNTAGFNTHPLFATLVAFVWLRETLSVQTVVGIGVVVVGLATVAASKGGDRGGWRRRDLAFPVLAAIAYSVSNVVRRFGLTTTTARTLEAIAINAVATLVVLLVYAAVVREQRVLPPRSSLYNFLVSGTLSAFALFFLFEAFARGPVAIVSALSGLSPVVATLVAAVTLSDVERVTAGVVAGAAFVVVGATLITLG